MKSFFYNLAGGLNSAATKTALGLDVDKVYWSDAKNVEIYKNRGITRQSGNIKIFEMAAKSPIVGLFAYQYDGEELIFFNCENENIYCYNVASEALKLIYTGFSAAKEPTYVRFLTGVAVSNGVNNPVYFDYKVHQTAVSCGTIAANGTPLVGNAMASYKSRLWLASGGTLYFSALGRYNDWTSADDAGYISNFLADIDEITALKEYKDYLAIYKKDATFLLSGTSPEDFAIQRFADKGAISQAMVENANNKQYFFDGAVFSLEQVGILSQISVGDEASFPVKSMFEEYNPNSRHKGAAIHNQLKNQVWFFFPAQDGVYLNNILIYDYSNKAWLKRVLPQEITCAACSGGKIYLADSQGAIYQDDTGSTFAGEPIDFYWKSPFFVLGEPNERKYIDEFYLLLDDSKDNSFRFSTYKDNDDSAVDDLYDIEALDNEALIWDSDATFWADDSIGFNWGKLGEGVYKAEITQSNYSVRIAIEGDKDYQNFCLTGLEFKEIYYD